MLNSRNLVAAISEMAYLAGGLSAMVDPLDQYLKRDQMVDLSHLLRGGASSTLAENVPGSSFSQQTTQREV